MSPLDPPSARTRGLILGGGGVTGIAWTTGLLCGLNEQGVDLQRAHCIVGTSAGSTVAAQITSGTAFPELFERQIDPARQSPEIAPEPPQLQALATMFLPLMAIENTAERIRRVGELALKSKTVDEAARRAVIEARLPTHRWPELPLRIVAVNAANGETRLFDRRSGVGIVDAVAASCAVPGLWPCVTINGHRYMDGGVRSSDNADLAPECTLLLVVSPVGLAGNADLAGQLAALESGGVPFQLVEPDSPSRDALGLNPFDLQRRAPCAHAGRRQGRVLGNTIAAFWA
jgi:NTE family protein